MAEAEMDQLIASIAEKKDFPPKTIEENCLKTLGDYQCLETLDEGNGTPHLRMIAWDRA